MSWSIQMWYYSHSQDYRLPLRTTITFSEVSRRSILVSAGCRYWLKTKTSNLSISIWRLRQNPCLWQQCDMYRDRLYYNPDAAHIAASYRCHPRHVLMNPLYSVNSLSVLLDATRIPNSSKNSTWHLVLWIDPLNFSLDFLSGSRLNLQVTSPRFYINIFVYFSISADTMKVFANSGGWRSRKWTTLKSIENHVHAQLW